MLRRISVRSVMPGALEYYRDIAEPDVIVARALSKGKRIPPDPEERLHFVL